MPLGQKLQNAYRKVNTKLGTQDGTVIIRRRVEAQGDFGTAYTSNVNSDVTIASGLKLSRLKAYEVDKGGVFQVGDLKIIVPGSLVTEAQIKESVLVYNNATYSVVKYYPSEIYSGVIVNWIIIARLEA